MPTLHTEVSLFVFFVTFLSQLPCPVLRRTNPGRAVEAYAAIKAAKYVDETNFVPFIVETGGIINRRAHLFLDVSPLIVPGTYTVRTYVRYMCTCTS